MKDLIYNLILASIGLFIVYVIFSNYLGTDNEGFEVDEANNTTTYDPDDAVTEARKVQQEKEDAQEDRSNPNAPTQLENAQAAADAAAAKAAGGEQNLPSADNDADAAPGESFQNPDDDDDDNSSKNSDNSNISSHKQPVGILQKIYSMIFGKDTQEGFFNRRLHWLRRHHRHFNRFRAGRRRTRRWRWRRRRRKHVRRVLWPRFVRRRNWYHHQWRRWHAWNRRRHARWRAARRRRAAMIRRQAAPYIRLWNKTNHERHQIAHRNHTALREVYMHNPQRIRIGHHTWREWGRKLKLQNGHPWNNNHWRGRGISYLGSVNYWMPRRRVRPGQAHWRWEAPGNAKQNAINWINWEVHQRKKALAEAKKSNERKANWGGVHASGTNFLGQFQDNKRMSKADEVQLQQTYGLTTPIKDWDKKNIEKSHNYITEKYNKIQDQRAAALKAKAALAFQQKQAAQQAAKDAAAASAALAAGEKAAAAEAAKAQAKAAAENAAAVAQMGSTFTTHVQKGRDNTAAINSRVTPMAEMNRNTVAQANSTKATIDDLLTLQGGRIAKVNAVPMEAIKKISLRARQNYDKSIANAAQG